jgi:hypothetical protein
MLRAREFILHEQLLLVAHGHLLRQYSTLIHLNNALIFYHRHCGISSSTLQLCILVHDTVVELVIFIVGLRIILKTISHPYFDFLRSWNALRELSDVVKICVSRTSHLVIGERWPNILYVLLNYHVSVIYVDFTCDHCFRSIWVYAQ